MGTLEKARLNFDGTRREFNKLELKRVRQQQAKDAVEPELASQLSAKQVSLEGELDGRHEFIGQAAMQRWAQHSARRLDCLRMPSRCSLMVPGWVGGLATPTGI